MMKYPKEYLEEIKTRLRVSQVVGKYVQLKKRGKEFLGLSPFKNEKTPSFTINDEKGFYHCFSTGEHGNIFDFLMKTQSIGFGEAVKKLALEAGMPQYRFTKLDQHKEKKFKIYKSILKDYKSICIENIYKKDFYFALQYLNQRGLTNETIKEFELGYAPDRFSSYKILSQKYSEEDISSTGIFYQNEKTKNFIDRFASRIIFPINNISGDTIAFGGRVLKESKFAKYINSPETEFYKKGKILFNLDKAKNLRQHTDEVVIVEGYMDVISLHNKGFKNIISNSGTAITDGQIQLIWKFFSKPVICLDGDKSGQDATLRIAERLLPLISESNKIYFSILDEGLDPDDYIKKNGRKDFDNFLKQKEIIQDFIWNKKIKHINRGDPFMISKFEKEIKKLAFLIKDETLKKYILEIFLERMQDLTPNQKFNNKFNFKKRERTRILDETKKIYSQRDDLSKRTLTEYSTLFLMINYPGAAKERIEEISKLSFSENLENLKIQLIDFFSNSSDDKISENFIKKNEALIEDIKNKTMIKNLVFKKSNEQIIEMIDDLIIELSNMNQLKRIDDLEKNLIKNFDENAYSELIKLKNQINRE